MTNAQTATEAPPILTAEGQAVLIVTPDDDVAVSWTCHAIEDMSW